MWDQLKKQGEWLPEEYLRLSMCTHMYSHLHTCVYPYRHKHKCTCAHSKLQWYTQRTTDYSHCFKYHLHLILSVWAFRQFLYNVSVIVIVWLLNVYSELMFWSLGPQLMVLPMSDEKFRGGIYVEEGGHWEHVFDSFVSEYLFLDDHVAISFHFRHCSATIQCFNHKPEINKAEQLWTKTSETAAQTDISF